MGTKPGQRFRFPRRRWLLLGAGLVAVVLVLLVQSNKTVLVGGGGFPSFDSYRLEGDRTVVLTLVVAPRSWTRVTNLVETPTEVRVTVESLDWPIPLPQTGELALEPVTVTLREALGSRAVVDSAGQAIPSR